MMIVQFSRNIDTALIITIISKLLKNVGVIIILDMNSFFSEMLPPYTHIPTPKNPC